MHIKLTSRVNPYNFIKSNPVFLRDTITTGFAIKVNPSGNHKYIAEFRTEHKIMIIRTA